MRKTQIVIAHNDYAQEVCAPGTTMKQAEARCKELKRAYIENHRVDPIVAYFHATEVDVYDPNHVSIEHTLARLAGYHQNGSAETLTISPDDATRTWHVRVGKRELGYGGSIQSAIEAAIKTMEKL